MDNENKFDRLSKESVAVASLAYAIYDSEHTTRLGEQGEEVIKAYMKKAETLLYMIREYRPREEQEAIAATILQR